MFSRIMDDDMVDEVKREGAFEVIFKPFNPEEIKKVVDSAVQLLSSSSPEDMCALVQDCLVVERAPGVRPGFSQTPDLYHHSGFYIPSKMSIFIHLHRIPRACLWMKADENQIPAVMPVKTGIHISCRRGLPSAREGRYWGRAN
ncbi:MAG TPA: hypothetical protein DD723_05430 [Candidatus Omnitrophica bacterium]|nr:MAG: hypothetical protein A2Z81_05625 [Omnitrophica WOR_2 bacterium GWA2_45_18]HBR14970.1 hypothetical protein [Candidatus Omnitrophota bacterium]